VYALQAAWILACRGGEKMNENAYNQTIYSIEDFYTEKIDHLTLAKALEIHYSLNPQFTLWYKYHSQVGWVLEPTRLLQVATLQRVGHK
jgi:hypothetical protein